MTSYLAPGGPAWYLCRSRGWVFSFYDAPHPPSRSSPAAPPRCSWRAPGSARVSSCRLPAAPRGPPSPHQAGHGSPRSPTLWRHWLWWRRNLYREHLRRGDLSSLVDAPRSGCPPGLASRTARPHRDDHYASLLAASMAGDLWVRRYRGLRRRRLTVHTAPPRPAGVRRTLFWAHRSHADLTWAPRPPRPAHIRARRGPPPHHRDQEHPAHPVPRPDWPAHDPARLRPCPPTRPPLPATPAALAPIHHARRDPGLRDLLAHHRIQVPPLLNHRTAAQPALPLGRYLLGPHWS